MNLRILIPVAALLLGASVLAIAPRASAHTHVGVGIGVGVPIGGYYGPAYGPGYGPGYYGPPRAYYYDPYYYAPGYYYPPPTVVYEAPQPVVTVQQAPAAYWYYCAASRTYFPYVKECPNGWQAVPAQEQTATQQPPAPAPAGRVTYSLGDVLFAVGRAELAPAATATLDTLIASIAREPNRHLVIEGHTDASGRAADNLALSQQRAEAVKRYLVAHGVPADRITAVGRGEAGALASNATSDGRRQNRRVDVIVS